MANNLGFKLSVSAQKAMRSLSSLGKSTKKTTANLANFQNQVRKANNRLTNISKDANRASDSFRKLNKSTSALSKGIGYAKFYLIARTLQTSIQSALDMVEVLNLFTVSLGTATDKAEEFVTEMSQVTGLDPTNLRSSVGTFSLLARSMGISTGNAEILATNITKLGLDLSSLMNIPINQVMQDLRSGLVGQSETVYKYGLDVTEASLKAEAMAQGISKSVRNMSQGEKMALRYSIMIKKSSLAHGDFAKTIEQPANQLRILASRFTTLARSVGTIFIPALRMVLPVMNAIVIMATRVADAIARMFGYTPPEGQGSLGNIGDSAEDAEDSVNDLADTINKKLRGSIDELNVLSENTGTGVGVEMGDPNLFEFEGYENFLDMVDQKAGRLADTLSNKLEPVVSRIGEFIATLDMPEFNFDPMADALDRVKTALEPLTEKAFAGLTFVWNEILVPLAEWTINDAIPVFLESFSAGLNLLDTTIETISPTLSRWWNNIFKPLGEWVADKTIEQLQKLTTNLEDLTVWIENNEETMNKWADIILSVVAIGAIGGLIGKLMSLYNIIAPVIGALVGGFLSIFTVGNPILLVIGLLVGWLIAKFGGITPMIEAVVKTFKEVWSTVAEWFKTKVYDPLVKYINGLIEKFKKLNKERSKEETINRYTSPFLPKPKPSGGGSSFPQLGVGFSQNARGGILDSGSFFQAGEFGKAEMIGSFDGKTTVMPLENTGFVEAIKKAVYDGVASASGSGGQVIENVVNIDGEVIYRNQKKVESKRGKEVMRSPSFSRG